MQGVDCSGLTEYLLKSMGVDPPGVQNAQMLFDYFNQPANHCGQDPALGALAFYGPNKKAITHVALCLSKRKMIEAGGGGSVIVSVDLALRRGAFVRICPIRFDPSFQGFLMPDYPELLTP